MFSSCVSPTRWSTWLAASLVWAAPLYGQLNPKAVWESTEQDATAAVAWGDWDGDGYPELAAANAWGWDRVYAKSGNNLALVWSDGNGYQTNDVAWGDWDGDGDLDLIAAATDKIRIYRNTGGDLEVFPAWESSVAENSTGIACGSLDPGASMDLAVANHGKANRVYRNDGLGALVSVWTSQEIDKTFDIALADIDLDGDLDMAVANSETPSRIYRNDGIDNFVLFWSAPQTDFARGVAWGDFDKDGDPDLAFANPGGDGVSRIYRNDGDDFVIVWEERLTGASDVAWGDWDKDGDLDLAFSSREVRVYRNEGGEVFLEAWRSVEPDGAKGVAWADYDKDGDLDLAAGNQPPSGGGPNRLYINDQSCVFLDLRAGDKLQGWKTGSNAATFQWLPDEEATEYHLNSVAAKTALAGNTPRSPDIGVGTRQCKAFAPDVFCEDKDALGGTTLLFYQLFSACGDAGRVEGP